MCYNRCYERNMSNSGHNKQYMNVNNGYNQNMVRYGYYTNNNCLQENRNYSNAGYNCFRGGTGNRQNMRHRPY